MHTPDFDPNVLPAEVAAFFRQIKPDDRTQVSMGPMDAWMLIALLQLASRSPLPKPFKRFARDFGTQLTALFPPAVRPYLEAGWDTRHDVPVPREADQ